MAEIPFPRTSIFLKIFRGRMPPDSPRPSLKFLALSRHSVHWGALQKSTWNNKKSAREEVKGGSEHLWPNSTKSPSANLYDRWLMVFSCQYSLNISIFVPGSTDWGVKLSETKGQDSKNRTANVQILLTHNLKLTASLSIPIVVTLQLWFCSTVQLGLSLWPEG